MSFATALLLALLPAAGNFAGGLIALWFKTTGRFLNYALHTATGIILAVISIEVMPQTFGAATSWMLACSFFAGGAIYVAFQSTIAFMQKDKRTGLKKKTTIWMIYLAVVVDLLGDGLLIGTSSSIAFNLALSLAAGQVLADIPEGFAAIATFRSKGISRTKCLLLAISFVIPVLSAAMFARSLTTAFKMNALVFVAGIYILAAIEDMLNEAHENAVDSHWSAISFLAGFSLFILVG